MKKKYSVLIGLCVIAILFGLVAFIFWDDIGSMIGINKPARNSLGENFYGKSMFLNIGNAKIELPNEFPKDILTDLKQDLSEKAGMPLQLEKTGNGLPFGIP